MPEPAKPQEEGKPDENFHEIFDLLEQGKRNGGNPLSSDDGEQVVIPPDPDEFAATVGGSTRAYGQAGLLAGHTGLPAFMLGSSPAFYSGFSPSSASASAPAEQALVEMGYRQPQIRAARELAGAGASNLLMQVRGVDSSVERDGEKLGKAIQEAVLGLDAVAPDAVGKRILQLVTLLSLDDSHLRGAASHLDASTLTEFLLSVIAQRGEVWPPGAIRAASIALELVMAAPWADTSDGHKACAGGSGKPAPLPPRVLSGMQESQQVRRPKGDVPIEPPAGPDQLPETIVKL